MYNEYRKCATQLFEDMQLNMKIEGKHISECSKPEIFSAIKSTIEDEVILTHEINTRMINDSKELAILSIANALLLSKSLILDIELEYREE